VSTPLRRAAHRATCASLDSVRTRLGVRRRQRRRAPSAQRRGWATSRGVPRLADWMGAHPAPFSPQPATRHDPRAYRDTTACDLPAAAAAATLLTVASAVPQPPQRQEFDEAFEHPDSPRCARTCLPLAAPENQQKRRREVRSVAAGLAEPSRVARTH
jgi:hypothetical protein